jgi:hypothetical protein
MIDTHESNAVSLSTSEYVNYHVYKSTSSTTITRQIGKLDDVLSYVGGLFSLLFMVLSFLFGSFSQYKYELYVAESLPDSSENGLSESQEDSKTHEEASSNKDEGKLEKVHEEDFNFFIYLLYACYDWMDVFGVSPGCSCCNRFKRIHEARESANE